MARARRWRELAPGLLVIAALTVLVGGVLGFARIGALHGDTLQLVVLAGSARDILEGSEVWIAGQRVGLVREVDFRPVAADTTQRLALTVDVLVEARPQLRRDTRAQIRTGGSLLGAPVVTLFGGSSSEPLLQDGDTLRALPQLDPAAVTGRFAGATEHLAPLRQNVIAVVGRLRSRDGVFGAVAEGGGFGAGPLGARVRRIAGRFGGGTVGRLLTAEDPVRVRIAGATARADSIRRVLTEPSGTVGRFRRDSTLAGQIAAVQAEVAEVRRLLDESRGTAGRALHDPVLARELASLQAELRALAADVRDRPLRYIVF